MAGAACKIIINNGYKALMSSLEQVVMSPLVRGPILPLEDCDIIIQKLADIDIAAYRGGKIPHGGLFGILKKLEEKGVVTTEVWEIYNKDVEVYMEVPL